MDMEQNNGPADKDNEFEWDLTMDMSGEEKEQWLLDILPIKQALLKARQISFKIINSPTLLLPKWREAVNAAGLPEKMIPRDVAT
ncbi:hypothetical protein V5O48_016189 [Marasmius crinis-equi]|uniref:Uncharacterized protein n=1 Tax=Marasmius crinis-equi TaxID=585013 RepID=A0ABR3ESE3_9AGAR